MHKMGHKERVELLPGKGDRVPLIAAIVQTARKKGATFIDLRRDQSRVRFPVPDKAHARAALARLPDSEGLSRSHKKVVAQRAANVMGNVTPGARRYGVARVTKSPAAARTQPTILIGVDSRQPIRGLSPRAVSRRLPIERSRKARLD